MLNRVGLPQPKGPCEKAPDPIHEDVAPIADRVPDKLRPNPFEKERPENKDRDGFGECWENVRIAQLESAVNPEQNRQGRRYQQKIVEPIVEKGRGKPRFENPAV